jgi:hypothetical protein
VAIEGYLKFELVVSLLNSLFPFLLATAQLRGDVLTNRQSRDKMFLSALKSADILAHLIGFLNERRQVNAPKNPQI